jgi:hypothetical protein
MRGSCFCRTRSIAAEYRAAYSVAQRSLTSAKDGVSRPSFSCRNRLPGSGTDRRPTPLPGRRVGGTSTEEDEEQYPEVQHVQLHQRTGK